MEAIPYIMYSIAVGVLSLGLVVRIVAVQLAERRANLHRCVAGSLAMLLASRLIEEDFSEGSSLPLHCLVGGRLLAVESMASMLSAVGCVDPLPLYRLVQRYDLDRWLLKRARRARGYRRARYLRLLAEIPHCERVADCVRPFLGDRRREVRFCALLVQLATYPERMISLIGAFEQPFTASEVAELLHLLRRGLLPIAYRPLLLAPNYNLRRVGLALVTQFGVEEAEDLLLRLLVEDEQLSERALGALVTLHRPLCRREVSTRIEQMPPLRRRSLLRTMASEGYGVGTVRRLCRNGDASYYETLIGTYKRSLVCG